MNSTDDQNQGDVNKQYQDILNKYAEDIKRITQDADTSAPPADSPTPPVEPVANITSIEPAPTINIEPMPVSAPVETSVLDEMIGPPTIEPAIVPSAPEPELPLTPPPLIPPKPVVKATPPFVIDEPLKAVPPGSGSGIFKYIFLLSFLIFLGVCGAVAYTLFIAPPIQAPEAIPTPVVAAPTPNAGLVCQLNDKTYKVGEGFTAADGCNSCTCNADLTIACTLMACDTTPAASTSAVPKDWKTYTNAKYKFSVGYPSAWKTSVGDNGLTVNFFAKSTDPEFISITVNDNPSSTAVDKWLVDKSIVPRDNNISTHISTTEVVVAGIKSISVTTPVNGGQTSTYIPKGNKIFNVYNNVNPDITSTQETYQKNIDFMNQILSTFKFF